MAAAASINNEASTSGGENGISMKKRAATWHRDIKRIVKKNGGIK